MLYITFGLYDTFAHSCLFYAFLLLLSQIYIATQLQTTSVSQVLYNKPRQNKAPISQGLRHRQGHKAGENKWVVIYDLKPVVGEDLMWRGRLFQSRGTTSEKAQSPFCLLSYAQANSHLFKIETKHICSMWDSVKEPFRVTETQTHILV